MKYDASGSLHIGIYPDGKCLPWNLYQKDNMVSFWNVSLLNYAHLGKSD